MDRFEEEGPSGLYDREREGRWKKITEEVEEEIEALLEGNPTDEAENATRWTTDRIAEHLERELGLDVHSSGGPRRAFSFGVQLDAPSAEASAC